MAEANYDIRSRSGRARFSDIATLLRAPRGEVSSDIDIGLVGVPFDFSNGKAGTRHGPAAIREASRTTRRFHPTSGVNPFEVCRVADLGDAPVNPFDINKSIADLTDYFSELHKAGIRPLSVGGDHGIPLPIVRAIASPDNPVGILQFDSHLDTMDELMGNRENHGTFMRRLTEEGLIDPKRVVQVGFRGSRYSDNDLKYGQDHGYTVITIDDYEEMGRARVIEVITKTLAGGPVYVTLDIDGIDPAYAPGTATTEIGGILPRDMQVMIRALAGLDIVGADINEVCPPLDPTNVTCNLAANLLFELVCVMALRKPSIKSPTGDAA